LLSEAKKRNPDIKTYGLPWAYPGWVGGPEQSGSPFTHPELTSKYILKWLEGARNVYEVEIDYIGIWNERASDAAYAKTLRKTLDAAGFANTTLVAKDGGKDICDDMAKDKDYADAIGVVGLHYPSDYDNYTNCRAIGFGNDGKDSKPIWSSEESSSHDDLNGAACWARIITSHWVLQGFTASIMWNLVASYFHGTNWEGSSMLTAQEPWTGNYNSMGPVWASAHVTQFTKVGWDLLKIGRGSGQLPKGGFYATYSDPKSADWTLTVVKIDEDHAPCTRPKLPDFKVASEKVTFKVSASMSQSQELAVWYSNFEDFLPDGTVKSLFQRLPNIHVSNGEITLDVHVGAFYTVSTILAGPTKGAPSLPVPASNPSIPLPLSDDFESYAISQEAKWWSDQIGAFEVHYESGSSGNKVMRQMVPELPIGWSDQGSNGPMTLLGMREWQDIAVSVFFKLPSAAPADSLESLSPRASTQTGCVGSRVDQMWQGGIVLCVAANGSYTLSVGGPTLGGKYKGEIYKTGQAGALPADQFSELTLTTLGSAAFGLLNDAVLFTNIPIRDLDTGFAAIGANDWFPISFDKVSIHQVGPRWVPETSKCPAPKVGMAVVTQRCPPNGLTVDNEAFALLADWGIRHIASGLCVSSGKGGLVLAECVPTDARQQFRNSYTRIRDTVQPIEAKVGGHLCGSDDGKAFLSNVLNASAVTAVTKWCSWSYFPNSKQLRNQYVADTKLGYPMCLSTCNSPLAAANQDVKVFYA